MMKNIIIHKMIKRSHYFQGFSNYVTLKFINNYGDKQICNIRDCYVCKKT